MMHKENMSGDQHIRCHLGLHKEDDSYFLNIRRTKSRTSQLNLLLISLTLVCIIIWNVCLLLSQMRLSTDLIVLRRKLETLDNLCTPNEENEHLLKSLDQIVRPRDDGRTDIIDTNNEHDIGYISEHIISNNIPQSSQADSISIKTKLRNKRSAGAANSDKKTRTKRKNKKNKKVIKIINHKKL